MKKNIKLIAILTVATFAVGGAAWLSAGPGVGTDKTIHMLASPT